MINDRVKCESSNIKRQSLKQDPGESASQYSSFINSGADVCEEGSDRAGGREMSHWARGRLIQVSWFADILQTKVSLQRIRESLLTMRGGEAVGGPVVCFVTAAEVMGCWVGKQKL